MEIVGAIPTNTKASSAICLSLANDASLIKLNQTLMAYQTVAGISQVSLTDFAFHSR
jgi:hypothetical protein